MSLRTKIFLSLICIAVIPLALFGAFANATSTDNLVSIERDALRSGLDSAQRVLSDVQRNLAGYIHDYTQWDELHDQVVVDQPDPVWMQINLAPETPTSTYNTFNLDLLGMWNYKNDLVYSAGAIDEVTVRLKDVISSATKTEATQTRLLSLGSDVYVVAVSAIRTSAFTDPQGILLVGRILGAEDTASIAALTGYDAALYKGARLIAGPVTQLPLPEDNELLDAISNDQYHYDQQDKGYALAFAPITDENGDYTVTLVIWRSRAALETSQSSLSTTLALAVGVGTILAILVAMVLGGSIVAPLNQMAANADNIAAGNYGQRINVQNLSNDELLTLANAFNAMTDQLAQRIDELKYKVDEIDEKNRALRIATAKAEEVARLRGEFLATMSHELRTPLNAIIGFSDVLLMGLGGALNQAQQHQVERLKENGNRLLTLINDVLDISRIEAGRIEIASESFAPAAMLERISEQMQVLAAQKQINFLTVISPSIPPTLVGDEKRLEQVIVNLLSNAFKFTDKGSVNLEATCASSETWSIAVRDSGIGIPPHALDLIFEPFRQVDGSSKRSYSGSGLGLAIAQQLIQSMGGKITVSSELGKGSTFTITLPQILADNTALQPKSQQQGA
ncbi:MAG: HAMP domain-containing protein [Anaerolineae bacterium]|nr:HAMP domain-containing protein [Anaerolineae bacterium]